MALRENGLPDGPKGSWARPPAGLTGVMTASADGKAGRSSLRVPEPIACDRLERQMVPYRLPAELSKDGLQWPKTSTTT
jgi:hypothetical protein